MSADLTTTHTVTVRAKNPSTGSPMDVTGIPTVLPHVYVTPRVDIANQITTGGWRLSHAPTGLALSMASYKHAADCHALAALLVDVVVDWGSLGADTATWPAEVAEQVKQILGDHYFAMDRAGLIWDLPQFNTDAEEDE